MTCTQAREYLYAFLDSELDAPLSIELQRHLEHCPRCAREAEIERTIRRRLATSMGRNALHVLPDERAVARMLVTVDDRERSRVARLGPWLAVAAAVATVVGGLLWLDSPGKNGASDGHGFASAVASDFLGLVAKDEPLELVSGDAKVVGLWLKRRTGLAVSVPRVSGDCKLLGARKCTIAGRTAAIVWYRMDGTPTSLIAVRGDERDLDGMKTVTYHGRTHHVDRCSNQTVVACRDGVLLYAAVSSLPESRLLHLMTGLLHESD